MSHFGLASAKSIRLRHTKRCTEIQIAGRGLERDESGIKAGLAPVKDRPRSESSWSPH